MNKVALLLLGSIGLLSSPTLAADALRGSVLELHSCELYAGGCTVSSEAPQGGRYMLRVWNFNGGEFASTKLAGLRMALLEASDQNLAAPGTHSSRGVLYLPESATAQQRAALQNWAKSTGLLPPSLAVQTRVVSMQITTVGDGYQFSAGRDITVRTASLESCPTGSCGEALWYHPRTQTDVFAVAVSQSSKIIEPLLKLNWQDHAKKSVFLARLAEATSPRNLYLSATDLCAPGNRLF